MKVNFTDKVDISSTTRQITDEGYLSGKAVLTTVGVQQYDRSLLTGDAKDAGTLVGVFRSHDTVFNSETMNSARMKPITQEHPNKFINASNYASLARGHLGDTVSRVDDKKIGSSVLVTDKELVDDITTGNLKEVSLGYTCNIKEGKGTFEGQDYEYMFDGPMFINHLAVVPAGRCGASVSILDKQEKTQMTLDQQIDDLCKNPEAVKKLKDALEKLEPKENKTTDAGTQTPVEDAAKKKLEDEAAQAKKIQDAAMKRSAFLDKARLLIQDEKIHEKTNREILELAFKDQVQEIKDKSDDYLMALLDTEAAKRQKAGVTFSDAAKTSGEFGDAKVFTSKEIKKLTQGNKK